MIPQAEALFDGISQETVRALDHDSSIINLLHNHREDNWINDLKPTANSHPLSQFLHPANGLLKFHTLFPSSGLRNAQPCLDSIMEHEQNDFLRLKL